METNIDFDLLPAKLMRIMDFILQSYKWMNINHEKNKCC